MIGSHRELEIAKLVAKGLRNAEIAFDLGVTEATVKYHLTQVYKKNGWRGRAQLILHYARKVKAP